MKACIIIPTYNESGNIQRLLEAIFESFKKTPHEMSVLVADDSSPDGTGEIVKSMMKKHSNLFLMTGKKEGLGRAYIRGFRHVLDTMGMDAVFMMDADFSHDPKLIPEFMRQLDEGYDFVIGSRYVKGGATPDWGAHRKVISFGGNMFARLVGGLYRVHDCTSGFRAIRTSLLRKIDFSALHTKGYAFLTTLLFEATANGARIKEIPLVFYDRKYGKTKLNSQDMVEFFFNAIRLRLKKSKKLIRFLITGFTGTLVNLFFLFAFTEYARLDKTTAAPILAIELSVLWNFFLNNFWTFGGTKSKKGFFSKFASYHLIALSGIVINFILYRLLLSYGRLGAVAGRFDYLLAQLIAICIVVVWNYFLSSRWTWKE